MIEAYLVNYLTQTDFECMIDEGINGDLQTMAQPVGTLYIGDLGDAVQQIIDTLIADDFRDNEREAGDELQLTAQPVDNNVDFITYELVEQYGNVYAVVLARKYELNLTI